MRKPGTTFDGTDAVVRYDRCDVALLIGGFDSQDLVDVGLIVLSIRAAFNSAVEFAAVQKARAS